MNSVNLAESNAVSSPGVKPTDRDDMAMQLDEAEVASLAHLNPDAAISAIMHGPAECTKRSSWADMSENNELNGSTAHATCSVSSPHPGFRTDAKCKVGYNLYDVNFTTDKHDYLHSFNCASNYTDFVDKHAPLKN